MNATSQKLVEFLNFRLILFSYRFHQWLQFDEMLPQIKQMLTNDSTEKVFWEKSVKTIELVMKISQAHCAHANKTIISLFHLINLKFKGKQNQFLFTNKQFWKYFCNVQRNIDLQK